MNEPRLYKLFKTLVSRDSDLRAIVKAKNELLRRIEQSHTSILETFTTLIDAAAWNVINLSSIGPLLKRLGKADGPRSVQIKTVAARYLALIAKECAPMFHTHVATLSVSVLDKKNDKVVEIAMQGIAALTKWDKSAGPSDKKTLERAQKLAVSGTPRQAKFAARFIAYCSEELAATELVDVRFVAHTKADKTSPSGTASRRMTTKPSCRYSRPAASSHSPRRWHLRPRRPRSSPTS